MDSGGGDVFGSSTATLTWHDFLERMRQPSAADFVKSIKSFIVSFSNKAPDPEKDSASLQEFLSNMEMGFKAHSLWAGCSEEELESAGEGLEKYVMTKLYGRAFASVPEDVKHDEELYEKMSLVQQFIRPENLDIKPTFQNETSWLLAQKELQKINMYKAPRDKLVCILNCCKVISNLLINASLASSDNPPGADEFLPVLIYVTIKANPPQLHSNLLYIQRYRYQSRLVSEAAYYFTNILSAESFIWNIDANSLSMEEIEFQRNMESARAVLLGLSTDTDSHTKQATHDVPEFQDQKAEQMKAKESARKLSTEVHLQPQAGDHRKDQDGKKLVNEGPSISDLETKGAAELLKDDQLSRYFHEYPFLYAHAGDLTVGDVESLLNSYKRLVLKYVSLSKGAGVDNTSIILPSSQTISETENSNEIDNAKELEADSDRFGEFCKAAESSNADSSLEVDGTGNLSVVESA